MRIAIASGKGGTGKTTVAASMAWAAAERGRRIAYWDCDVEAPNGHLFLRPALEQPQEVVRLVPRVDDARCVQCGRCGEFCQFGAIARMGRRVVVFPELCHSCAGCRLICPSGAITGVPRAVGAVEKGRAGALEFAQGRLHVGETSSPTVIRALKGLPTAADWVILDAPPGTACPMVETVRDADYVLLVTDPTPFGLHDLELAVATVRALGVPFGVVLNRADPRDRRVNDYCRAQGIRVWLEIPEDRRIAEAYARGRLAVEVAPGLAAAAMGILDELTREHAPRRERPLETRLVSAVSHNSEAPE